MAGPSTRVISRWASDADDEDHVGDEPDLLRAVAIDAQALEQPHREAADHADADDHAQRQFVAAQELHEVRVAEQQAEGRHHQRVGGVRTPELMAIGPFLGLGAAGEAGAAAGYGLLAGTGGGCGTRA